MKTLRFTKYARQVLCLDEKGMQVSSDDIDAFVQEVYRVAVDKRLANKPRDKWTIEDIYDLESAYPPLVGSRTGVFL